MGVQSSSRGFPIPSYSTLLFPPVKQHQLVEIDRLIAGSAAAGPPTHDGFEEQHRLRQTQAATGLLGRGAPG